MESANAVCSGVLACMEVPWVVEPGGGASGVRVERGDALGVLLEDHAALELEGGRELARRGRPRLGDHLEALDLLRSGKPGVGRGHERLELGANRRSARE